VPTDNVIQWGERIYYFNCHRKGIDFKWFTNNLQLAKGSPSVTDITVNWLFNNKWQPVEELIKAKGTNIKGK